jgi:cytochrome c553
MVGRRTLMAVGLALACGGVTAQETTGADRLSMCQGCHGIPGYRTAFPEVYPVPLLGGQHADYIVAALQAYRDGSRSHPSMQAIARGLNDEQMRELADYYAQGRR